MIRKTEIIEKAKKYQVPISTIERDYVQSWMLKYLSQLDLVLKGGTGIRKTYFENYRFSDDLDFTILNETKSKNLLNETLNILDELYEESGIYFDKKISITENVNGYEINTYFQIAQRGTNLTKIKIDVTKNRNEPMLLPCEEKKIIHLYSDSFESMIRVYSLEEVIAEKIRSLFQRTRPRDLYDIWYLWNKVDLSKIKIILPEKFKIKKIEYNIQDFSKRKKNYENAWKNSLVHQIKPLPDFKIAYETVYKNLVDYIE